MIFTAMARQWQELRSTVSTWMIFF
jgi:hypothetical protein